MTEHIPFLRPNLVPRRAYEKYFDQIDASHLYSNYGPLNTEFEQRVLQGMFQGRGAVSTMANATLGLVLAILESKREGGRYAIMPSFTFAATPLAAQWCGLEPYFIDVCLDTWCMDLGQLERALELLGKDVAVVLPYACFGTALDLTPFHVLQERGFPVVVDAAPCFGTENFAGHFGLDFPGTLVFSFHATKAFGVGEGGLVYSSREDLIKGIRRRGNFGFSAERESLQLGLNSKMSEYTAAIALASLDNFPEKAAERLQIHQWYLQALGPLSGAKEGWAMQIFEGRVPWQFMSVLCPEGTREARMKRLTDAGIECRTYFAPACHEQLQFSACPRLDLTITELLSRRILSLPLWEGMERGDVARVAEVLAG